MTSKPDFTAQDWALLQRALRAPGQYLVLADPTSQADLAKGARAIEGFYVDVRDQAARRGLENELLETLLADDSTSLMADVYGWPALDTPEAATLKQRLRDDMAQAAELLDAKATPQEAREVKIKMYQLAGATAAASKQGSFLGFGGTRVTDAERAALAEVATTLGIDPADATESWPLPGQ